MPDTTAFEAALVPIRERAAAIVVDSPESYEAALKFDQELAGGIKMIDEYWDPLIGQAHSVHKALCARRSEMHQRLGFAAARPVVSQKAITWKRKAEEAAEIERRRLEREARKAEEERALRDAQAAEEAGDTQLRDEILDAPIEAPAIAAPVAAPKVSGSTTVTTWNAQVVDKMALVKYVAAHPEWLHLLDANDVALRGLATSQKEKLAIPGVRPIKTERIASRSR